MTRSTSGFLNLSFAFSILLGGVAGADEIAVDQRQKAFWPTRLTVTVGDKVVFTNNDEVTHNMFSRTEGHKFNLKMQKPGERKDVSFDTPGEVLVRCAIHPKMKLVVEVEK